MKQHKQSDKVRYAVVGGGWIAQAAFMPGVEHTGNSRLTALISGDEAKMRALGERYKVKTWAYEQYSEALASGEFDAVYISLPNWMHREYAVPALEAGLHVLLEKPMATRELDCRAIMAAAERSGAKLMIAYRLHFEPATLQALRIIHSGELGAVRLFSSVFTQYVAGDNHRAANGFWAGPVADMGPYPINAARLVFGAEPIEVSALGAHDPAQPFDFHETVAVTMRFPGHRLAQFTVSYAGNPIDQYRVVGEKGDLELSPAYLFGPGLKHRLTIGEKTTEREFPATDQFGGELHYFSECILHDRQPEPNGAEGLADVRVISAIERALESGEPQQVESGASARQPLDPRQVEKLAAVETPELVEASAPGEG